MRGTGGQHGSNFSRKRGRSSDLQHSCRPAFNEAFKRLGINAEFTPDMYGMCMKLGDGTAEGMVDAYCRLTAYPDVVTDRKGFCAQVHAAKQVRNMSCEGKDPGSG